MARSSTGTRTSYVHEYFRFVFKQDGQHSVLVTRIDFCLKKKKKHLSTYCRRKPYKKKQKPHRVTIAVWFHSHGLCKQFVKSLCAINEWLNRSVDRKSAKCFAHGLDHKLGSFGMRMRHDWEGLHKSGST